MITLRKISYQVLYFIWVVSFCATVSSADDKQFAFFYFSDEDAPIPSSFMVNEDDSGNPVYTINNFEYQGKKYKFILSQKSDLDKKSISARIEKVSDGNIGANKVIKLKVENNNSSYKVALTYMGIKHSKYIASEEFNNYSLSLMRNSDLPVTTINYSELLPLLSYFDKQKNLDNTPDYLDKFLTVVKDGNDNDAFQSDGDLHFSLVDSSEASSTDSTDSSGSSDSSDSSDSSAISSGHESSSVDLKHKTPPLLQFPPHKPRYHRRSLQTKTPEKRSLCYYPLKVTRGLTAATCTSAKCMYALSKWSLKALWGTSKFVYKHPKFTLCTGIFCSLAATNAYSALTANVVDTDPSLSWFDSIRRYSNTLVTNGQGKVIYGNGFIMRPSYH